VFFLHAMRRVDRPECGVVVEALNDEPRLTTREACGLRTFDAVKTALYPDPGSLPEPEFAHRFP
jgi:hypothetical protein